MKPSCYLRFFPILAALWTLSPTDARAENYLGIYLGASKATQSDVRIIQPFLATDQTFYDVDWSTKSFEDPQYYGLRYTHYFDDMPYFGFMIDYTHDKIYGKLSNVVGVNGTNLGQPVNGFASLSTTFTGLSMSHGLNTVTVGPVARCFLWGDDPYTSIVQPYIGIGVGAAIPHVEVQFVGQPIDESYRWGGIVVEGRAGVNVRVSEHCSIFAEVKVMCIPNLNVDITGGNLQTQARQCSFLFGPALTW